MKFYEHHLGDYAGAAGHLSMLEHGAYRLLLDRYYATEQPLPADLLAIYRVARARSADERAAVDAVLAEFFVLEGGEYRNRRCDAEIARYQEHQTEREAKRDNEAERQRRARVRRQKLFDQLRGFDMVPKWDTSTADLERLLAEAQTKTDLSAPVTHLSRVTGADIRVTDPTCHAPVTPLITVVHTHPHTHPHRSLSVGRSVQDPEASRANPDASATDRPGDEPLLPTNVQAAKAMIAAGCASTQVNPTHPALMAACDEGATPQMLADVVTEGVARSPPPDKPFTWAIGVVRGRLRDARAGPASTAKPVKPNAADDFRGKSYAGTDPAQFPEHLRAAVAAELAAGG